MQSHHKSAVLLTVCGVFLGVQLALASPPDSKYAPGETLTPTCAPGSTNCTVTPPITSVSLDDASVTIPKLEYYPKYPVVLNERYLVDTDAYDSLILHMDALNSSGGSYSINGYQLWLSFQDGSGNTLTKPSTSTAFDAENYAEIATPGGAISNGATGRWVIDLQNIWYEKPDAAVTYSLHFRVLDGGSSVQNLGHDLSLESISITPYIGG